MKRPVLTFVFLSMLAMSCTDTQKGKNNLYELEVLKTEIDSLKNVLNQQEARINKKIYTFLTFQKEDAEQAMNFYMEMFDNSSIIELKRWGNEGPGKEGTIMHATFSLNGKLYMCSDSPPIHEWDFTPAVANFVQCEDASEIERLFLKLSENGEITMPLNNYGFSKKFGWVIDQFGVSWQLNLD